MHLLLVAGEHGLAHHIRVDLDRLGIADMSLHMEIYVIDLTSFISQKTNPYIQSGCCQFFDWWWRSHRYINAMDQESDHHELQPPQTEEDQSHHQIQGVSQNIKCLSIQLLLLTVIIFMAASTTYILGLRITQIEAEIDEWGVQQQGGNIPPLKDGDEGAGPQYYIKIKEIKNVKELPLCILTTQKHSGLESIGASIHEQGYRNFRHVLAFANGSRQNQYARMVHSAKAHCWERCVIVMANAPLLPGSLTKINEVYQRRKVWLTYYNRSDSLGITSFYPQLLHSTISNDFHKFYIRRIERGQDEVAIPAVLKSMYKLSSGHSLEISYHTLYSQEQRGISLSYCGCSSFGSVETGISQPMISLSQNYQVNVSEYEKNYELTVVGKEGKHSARSGISQEQMLMAIEMLEIKNLPQEHVLNDREQMILHEKYPEMLKYSDSELPLCVVMPSYNNTENSRCFHSMQSVSLQNYTNYRVIFIDDASTDSTTQITAQAVKDLGIEGKVVMIKNSNRKFATLNIRQGVREHCGPEDIVVLVDGDDQLVGRQVFKLINMAYQREEAWIVYTNYLMSDFKYGGSRALESSYFSGEKRQKGHYMSPLRTFYAALYLRIQEKDHQDSDGRYLTILYDEAMQYPMLEMAGMPHAKYIPELTYFYNTGYGNNDDADGYKLKARRKTHDEIVKRPKYQPLQQLF